MKATDEEGSIAVRAARSIAEAEAEGRVCEPEFPESFSENSGVFVTLNEYPSGALRGCIGYVEPTMPLRESLALAARGVCRDPRFPKLQPKQAREGVFEVTILTKPEEIGYKDAADLMSKIEIGRDGLILTCNGSRRRPVSAVYLPQVPVEQGWNVEEYLSSLCRKAGLPSDAWRSGALGFAKFQGAIFGETSPDGEVLRKEL